jgi:hypothetical protein
MSGHSALYRLRKGIQAHPRSLLIATALGAAGAALAVPGPTGELSGIASVLAVAGLAVLAGHGWGFLVSGAASTMMLAYVWPIVATGKHSGWGGVAATASFALAVPGAFTFARALPRRIHGLIGQRVARLPGAPLGASAAALAVLVALPVLNARPAANATSSTLVAASRPAAPPPSALPERDPQAVTPGAHETLQIDLDRLASREDRPVPFEGDAKAIAPDPSDRGEERASAARKALHLVGSLLWIGYDEARRRLAEEQIVDAVSGAAWQPDVEADSPALP